MSVTLKCVHSEGVGHLRYTSDGAHLLTAGADALVKVFDVAAGGVNSNEPKTVEHPNIIQMPHLGASTEEAEDNAASMAAATLVDFVENGNVVNSVNHPTARLERIDDATRLYRDRVLNQGGLPHSAAALLDAGVLMRVGDSPLQPI